MSSDDDVTRRSAAEPAGQPYQQPYPYPQPYRYPQPQPYPPYPQPAPPVGGLGPIGRPLDRPPVVQRLRPVQQLGNVSIALICLTTALLVAVSATDWNSYLVVRDYLSDAPTTTDADLYRADTVSLTVSLLMVAILIAAGVVFLCWLSRARANAELLCRTEHRRGRGWVIGAWFCPIVNFWFPMQIVDDVWRASDPNHPVTTPTFRTGAPPTSGLVHLWWWPLIIAGVINWASVRSAAAEPTAESLRTVAITGTVSTLLYIVATVGVVLIIRRISIWQTQPRQPFWQQSGFAAPVQ